MQAECVISSQREIAPRHFSLVFKSSEIAMKARAGQFVHILPRSQSASDPLLRRAFSILRAEDGEVEVLYRVMGRGTAAMSQWSAGDLIDVIGPLGKPFEPLTEYSLLVGGGVGVPPLAMLASTRVNQKVEALVGARSAQEVLCRREFMRYGVPFEVTTDDGSEGHHGFVTELLQSRIESAKEAGILPTVFSCGPLPMLRAVAAICESFGTRCFVSLEENMPCGVGVCNGCVVPVTGQGDAYSRFRRICIDGPALDANDVDWLAWNEQGARA